MNQKLTKYQREVLVGILLGDACLRTDSNGRTFRLSISQCEAHKEYVFHLYEIFKDLVTFLPVRYIFKDKRNPKKEYFRWSFSTTQQGCLRFYARQFYKDGEKRVPKLIHKYLQPRSIAYWYMDDGAQKWKHRSKGVRFCTDNFTLLDVQHLARVLQTRYALKVSLQKKGKNFRIYVSSYSFHKMKPLIYPYLIESMRYKFPTLEAG